MGERAEGEGVLIRVLRLADEVLYEDAGADVVQQVAHQLVAEGVVADVLNDGSAIGVGVGFPDLVRRDAGIAAAKQRDDVGFPGEVDDLLMREDGVGGGGCGGTARSRTSPRARSARQRAERFRIADQFDAQAQAGVSGLFHRRGVLHLPQSRCSGEEWGRRRGKAFGAAGISVMLKEAFSLLVWPSKGCCCGFSTTEKLRRGALRRLKYERKCTQRPRRRWTGSRSPPQYLRGEECQTNSGIFWPFPMKSWKS